MKPFVKFTIYFTTVIGIAIAGLYSILDIEQIINYSKETVESSRSLIIQLIQRYTIIVLLVLVATFVTISILYLLYSIHENTIKNEKSENTSKDS